jgi:hypothetical protein
MLLRSKILIFLLCCAFSPFALSDMTLPTETVTMPVQPATLGEILNSENVISTEEEVWNLELPLNGIPTNPENVLKEQDMLESNLTEQEEEEEEKVIATEEGIESTEIVMEEEQEKVSVSAILKGWLRL